MAMISLCELAYFFLFFRYNNFIGLFFEIHQFRSKIFDDVFMFSKFIMILTFFWLLYLEIVFVLISSRKARRFDVFMEGRGRRFPRPFD